MTMKLVKCPGAVRTTCRFVLQSLVCIIAVMAAGLAQGQIRYQQSGDWFDTDLSDGTGWQGGVLPGAGDQARINWGGNTVTLAGTAPTVLQLQTGVDESGTLVINAGGVLTTTDWIMVGTAAGPNPTPATGGLIINNGGVANIGNHFWSGVAGSTGISDINSGGILNVGGILGLGTVNASTPSGGVATLNVNDGGLVNLSNIQTDGSLGSIQPGSLLDIYGSGLVTLPGDFVPQVTPYITAGRIAGNGIPGAAQAVFDSGLDQTLITVIPEPSTFVLMTLMGAALAMIRLSRKG